MLILYTFKQTIQELFINYKQQYEDAKKSVIKDTEHIKQLEIEYEKFRKHFSETLDRNDKKQFIDAAKQISEQRERVLNEKKVSHQIMNEYEYMKKISTLEEFKIRYGNKLYEILKIMMKFNPKDRCNFSDVYYLIQVKLIKLINRI